nr:hypothetical protein BaRGS_015278 [Batillaria attramentaria]
MSSYLLWAPAGVGAVLYVWSNFNMTLGSCLVLPLALLILSATWSPHLQAAVVRVKAKGQGGCRRNPTLSLIYTLFRISTVPLTLYLIMFFKIDAFRHDVTGFLHHVTADVRDSRVWLPVLLASVFGLVSVMIGGMASKVALNSSGMRIPALVTPFVSLGAATLLWNDMESDAFWELSGSDVFTWTASGVALLAWLIPFVVPGIPTLKTPKELLKPFSENFFAFSWRPFFLEHHLMLNSIVDNDGSGGCGMESYTKLNNEVDCGKAGGKSESIVRRRQVFICTTMYLTSLKRAFTSDKLQHVDLEAHIFLDNCIEEDLGINMYARQLLFLLTTVLHVAPTSLVRHSTPYGCQVTCRCVGGYMLYVHCKNGREFKPKKRWSQVMYMNYILNHRASRQPKHPDHLHQSTTQPTHTSPSYYPASGWGENLDSKVHGDKYASDNDREKPGKIWFSSEEVLPPDTTEALHRMFRESQNKLSNVPVMHCAAKAVTADLTHQHEETGSESAVGSSHDTGSDPWREAYALSMESTTSCNCSDTDDDSDMFSFRGVAAKVTCNRNDIYGKESHLTLSKWKETQVVASTVSCRKATITGVSNGRRFPPNAVPCEARLVERDQTPLCNLRQAGVSFHSGSGASVNLWQNFNACPMEEPLKTYHTTAHVPEKTGSGSDDVYILATDADTEFNGGSVRALVDQCEADHSLGAVCGRTVPVGGLKPIVWYQKFEYAKGHLYRGAALRDVMDTFSRPSASAYDTLVKDHGFHILFYVPLLYSAPVAYCVMLTYFVVCVTQPRHTQRMVTQAIIALMVGIMVAVSVGFVEYVVDSLRKDLEAGQVEFKPYFLVLVLIGGTMYAALLHANEGPTLMYGLAYAALFPAMFLALPVYSIANMVDTSWGTRELSDCRTEAYEITKTLGPKRVVTLFWMILTTPKITDEENNNNNNNKI